MTWLERYLPFLLSTGFISVLLGLRGLRFRLRYRTSPFRFPAWRDQSLSAWLSRLLVVILAAILLLTGLAAFAPEWLARLDPWSRVNGPATAVGAVLVLIGGGLVWRAQDDMQEAWRVGIDPRERTLLVRQGLFQFCRNPIYLGLQIALVGFAAMLPGLCSLALLAVSLPLLHVQTRLEESHLRKHHGADYAEYCRSVGRFFPWTGRIVADRQDVRGS